jgi:hypothetical protein
MITFKKVTEADEQLNSQIEELNRKVFPSAETTANLHFPTQKCWKMLLRTSVGVI